jgi:hypothetical protein
MEGCVGLHNYIHDFWENCPSHLPRSLCFHSILEIYYNHYTHISHCLQFSAGKALEVVMPSDVDLDSIDQDITQFLVDNPFPDLWPPFCNIEQPLMLDLSSKPSPQVTFYEELYQHLTEHHSTMVSMLLIRIQRAIQEKENTYYSSLTPADCLHNFTGKTLEPSVIGILAHGPKHSLGRGTDKNLHVIGMLRNLVCKAVHRFSHNSPSLEETSKLANFRYALLDPMIPHTVHLYLTDVLELIYLLQGSSVYVGSKVNEICLPLVDFLSVNPVLVIVESDKSGGWCLLPMTYFHTIADELIRKNPIFTQVAFEDIQLKLLEFVQTLKTLLSTYQPLLVSVGLGLNKFQYYAMEHLTPSDGEVPFVNFIPKPHKLHDIASPMVLPFLKSRPIVAGNKCGAIRRRI